jgi:glycosyltransferase involved in cell wall biosynthesis
VLKINFENLVIQSTSFEHGGAAIAAKRWADALGLKESQRQASTSSPYWISKALNKIIRKSFWRDDLFYSRGPVSLALMSQDSPMASGSYFTHWVQNDFISLPKLRRQSDKTIWYMHDEWLLLGLGHYSAPYEVQIKLPRRTQVLNILVKKWKFRFLIMGARGVCVPSNWLKEELIQRGLFANQIKVIPNPIPDHFFYPPQKNMARQELNISVSEKVILVVASSNIHDKRKGIDLIVPTIEEFIQRFGEVSLISVGIDDLELEIPGLVHKSWKYVNSEDELILLYAAADVLFVPSRLDNLPQVITEAQSVGLPVVAFDVGGIRDAILFPGKSAILIQPYLVSDAARALSHFCNHSEDVNRDIWVNEAFKKWSYKSVAGSFAEYYDNLNFPEFKAP